MPRRAKVFTKRNTPAYTTDYAVRKAKRRRSTSSASRKATYGKKTYRRVNRSAAARYRRGASASNQMYKHRLQAAVGLRLHPCVKKFYEAMFDPFGQHGDACNPFLPPLFSERCHVWMRQAITSANFNAAGAAFVSGRPLPVNDAGCLRWSTTAAFASMNTSVRNACPRQAFNNSRFNRFDFVFGLTEAQVRLFSRLCHGCADCYS